MSKDSIVIVADDDFPLAANYYPGGDTALLISAAMAVAQSFYDPIARFFQEQGYSVVTFDYRGIGASQKGPTLRGFHASMSDWALRDQAGAMKWVHNELNPKRFFMLGHSLGGQLPGLNSGVVPIDAMAALCSLSGYWRLQPKFEPAKVLFHTNVTFPLTCALLGYMPWSRFAKGRDLPKQAALQWAAWCNHPDYLFSDPSIPHHRFEKFQAPVLACSIDDDAWSTPKAVDALMLRFPNVERRHLKPADFGLSKLGHFGFFRPDSAAAWPFVLDWFESQEPGISSTTETS